MWKIFTAASTALVLLGTPALADWEGWNANADAGIDQTEFGTGFGEGGVFGEWDGDDDNQLSEDEWNAGYGERDFGMFNTFDEDDNQFLSEDEYNAGVFGGYDADDDGMLTQEEYGEYEDDEWF